MKTIEERLVEAQAELAHPNRPGGRVRGEEAPQQQTAFESARGPALPFRAVEAFYAAGHWLYARGRFDDAETVFRAVVRLAAEAEQAARFIDDDELHDLLAAARQRS